MRVGFVVPLYESVCRKVEMLNWNLTFSSLKNSVNSISFLIDAIKNQIEEYISPDTINEK